MKHLSRLLFSAALFFLGAAFAEETPAPQPEILKVTSDYKPEIFSFDFHMPRLNNPELVNAADFGLSGKSTPEENALAIEKIANYLRGKSNWKLILPGGEIAVKPVAEKKLLHLTGCKDFIVEGNSTRFLFDEVEKALPRGKTRASSGYVTVEKCERGILRNFKIGRDIRIAPLALFGMITQYDPETRTGKLQVQSDECAREVDVPRLSSIFNTTAERPRDLERAIPAYGDHGFVKKWEMLSPKLLQFTLTQDQHTSCTGKYAMVMVKPVVPYNGFTVGEND